MVIGIIEREVGRFRPRKLLHSGPRLTVSLQPYRTGSVHHQEPDVYPCRLRDRAASQYHLRLEPSKEVPG